MTQNRAWGARMPPCVRWLQAALVVAALGLTEIGTAQTAAWRAEVPAGTAPAESEVVTQLASRFEGAGRKLRITQIASSAPAPKTLQDAQAGSAQLALVPVTLLASSARDFAVFDSLFLFHDLAAVDRYTRSVEGRRLLESLGEQRLRGLGFVHVGMVQMAARTPIDPKALAGLRIASPADGVTARQFEALHMTAKPVPAAGLATALQQGLVDTIEVSWQDLANQGRASGMTVLESNHRYRGYVLVANAAAFAALPPDARSDLLAAAEIVIGRHNSRVGTEERQAREKVVQTLAARPISDKEYEALVANLKSGGWASTQVEKTTLAKALSVSSLNLAQQHYGTLAPTTTLAWAKPYAPTAAIIAPPPVSMSPPPPVAAAEPVVYNADLAPQLPRDSRAPDRPVLAAGKRVTLRFDLGPKWTTSVLAGAVPDKDLVQSTKDVPLTVVLSCGFCEAHTDSLRRTVFHAEQRRADEIRFEFVPKVPGDGKGYAGKLHLAVINDATGRDFDRLVIPISVSVDGAAVAAGNSRPIALPQSKPPRVSDWQPDVILYATKVTDRNITIEVEPVSPDMKSRLGPLAFDAQGQRRRFRTGVDDRDLVEAMTNSAYGALSAVSKQTDAMLRKLSATGTEAAVSKQNQESLHLTDAESASVAGVIGDIGQTLYRRLFVNSADAELRQLIVALEAAAQASTDRPLRVKVVTDHLSLPWQYLHPTGPAINPAKFWGMQFSLSVLRVSTPENGLPPAADDARKIVFARYGSSADPTVPLAEDQARLLLEMPMSSSDLLKVSSGPDLLAAVTNERKHIGGILTFLHASSTESIPQLQFNEADVVTSDKLSDLLNVFEPTAPVERYLAAAPLVILNACETGPSRGLPYVKLQDAMFELGARGVVVTEVSVWVSLGHEVARRLIGRLIKGEPVSDALTAVRRELNQEKNNPLGLLYVYYGDPAATLRH